MHFTDDTRFMQAASALGKSAEGLLLAAAEGDRAEASEIRLRIGSPIILSLPSGQKEVGDTLLTREMMNDIVMNLCGHSLYSHQQEIAAGYISVPGGHRAGLCGRAVIDKGRIDAVTDITGICLRIAREHSGCARQLCSELYRDGLCSAVIAGAPCSGKSTLLRDMACLLASGELLGMRLNVAVADERGELAMTQHGDKPGQLGTMCDVLCGYTKAQAMIHAVRCLAPDVIVCDELATEDDVSAVRQCVNAGVKLICSVHAGSIHELSLRAVTSDLIKMDAFEKFAVLEGRKHPGKVKEIIDSERLYEMVSCSADNYKCADNGNEPVRPSCAKIGIA